MGNMEFLITTRNNIITVIITDQRNMGAFIRQGCVLLNNMWVVLHRVRQRLKQHKDRRLTELLTNCQVCEYDDGLGIT